MHKAKSEHYTNDFYNSTRNYSRQSAEVIVPLVLDLFSCKQVVDVGCGDGTWLKIFQKYGVEEVLGIDGDYIDTKILQIPQNNFISFDKIVFSISLFVRTIQHFLFLLLKMVFRRLLFFVYKPLILCLTAGFILNFKKYSDKKNVFIFCFDFLF